MSIHVAIIGAYGSAGSAVASELVDEPNIELSLIDDGDPGGGLCILQGCMPSKELLSAAAHRYQVRHDDRLTDGIPEVDLGVTVAEKDDRTLGWAKHRRNQIHEWAEHDDVEFYDESARFVDDRTLSVGGKTIDPDYIVVATGSQVNIPDIAGIEEVNYMTSSDVLDANEFSDSGIVLGFGYVGLEMAPYLVEAGDMDITVVEHDDRPLDEADPEFGDEILEIYREDFDIDIITNAQEERINKTETGVELLLSTPDGQKTVTGDELFCFTGRQANIKHLGLEAANIDLDGAWVKQTMQARDNDSIYVVGDANEHEPILHVAKEQGQTAAKNILNDVHGEPLEPYTNIHHHIVFSGLGIYPFARVGDTPTTAKAAGHDVVVATRQASDDGIFKSKNVPKGLARLVVDRTDGTILGYQGLHYHADTMAKTAQVLVELGLDVREVPDRAYHPTLPELLDGLFREAATKMSE
ncbi:NAD(P)/FAD-dependent oxidoreductase [Salinarchaeum sp. IM2453]|uniref:dihydrolipoyl dehydrogenase family protein n=1 Tax=Salinarchaeum sp. IM2453 TaxID=2862870 RepID=UPI001C830A1C|nr:NAD(P)/FAD-dependent oxidoreductase [Salinarchaeum sp. IM2453]QZA88388.1 NAD(P)/FAD-dependent oxidoreductase [Salinarchaeum sp. IM2453]